MLVAKLEATEGNAEYYKDPVAFQKLIIHSLKFLSGSKSPNDERGVNELGAHCLTNQPQIITT